MVNMDACLAAQLDSFGIRSSLVCLSKFKSLHSLVLDSKLTNQGVKNERN